MSDLEDDYSSEGDDDYVPSGEASEGDSDDGEPVAGDESGDEEVTGKAQSKSTQKKKKQLKASKSSTRKRKGGIQLDGEDKEAKDSDNNDEEQINTSIDKEEEKRKKEEQEKKRKADLWSSFLKDVGQPVKSKVGTSAGSSGKPVNVSGSKPSSSTVKPSIPQTAKKEMVTVTKIFDFAGETVKVTEKVSADSKEAKMLKKEDASDKPSSSSSSQTSKLSSLQSTGAGPSLGVKRPAGLSSVLGQLGKKPKISTLEKSRLDWNTFKSKEGIEDELTAFVKGKSGYVEKQNFLARADQRQYEKERELRLAQTKILR